jgi:hypothetical protein
MKIILTRKERKMKLKSKRGIVCVVALLTIIANVLVLTVSASHPIPTAAAGTYRPSTGSLRFITLRAPNEVSGRLPLQNGFNFDTAFSASFTDSFWFNLQANPTHNSNLSVTYNRYVSYATGSAQPVFVSYHLQVGHFNSLPRQIRATMFVPGSNPLQPLQQPYILFQ